MWTETEFGIFIVVRNKYYCGHYKMHSCNSICKTNFTVGWIHPSKQSQQPDTNTNRTAGAEARSVYMLWWYFVHNTCKYNSTGNVHNGGRHLCSDCCGGKGIRSTYYEGVFVAFRIQQSMRMRHIVVCIQLRSTVIVYIISLTTQFTKNNLWNSKWVFWSSLDICRMHFPF